MLKFLTFLALIVIASLAGGMYGIIHDQITYTISPEYYTRFKFYQFGLVDSGMGVPNPRLAVSVVGVMATWWMGLGLGIVLGLIGFIQGSAKAMFMITFKAFLITIGVAFITGLCGLGYGYLFLMNKPMSSFQDGFIPEGLIDVKRFIM